MAPNRAIVLENGAIATSNCILAYLSDFSVFEALARLVPTEEGGEIEEEDGPPLAMDHAVGIGAMGIEGDGVFQGIDSEAEPMGGEEDQAGLLAGFPAGQVEQGADIEALDAMEIGEMDGRPIGQADSSDLGQADGVDIGVEAKEQVGGDRGGAGDGDLERRFHGGGGVKVWRGWSCVTISSQGGCQPGLTFS